MTTIRRNSESGCPERFTLKEIFVINHLYRPVITFLEKYTCKFCRSVIYTIIILLKIKRPHSQYINIHNKFFKSKSEFDFFLGAIFK